MYKDKVISFAVENLYKIYIHGGDSYDNRKLVENAKEALETLSEYYPVAILVIKENEDHYWLEEEN